MNWIILVIAGLCEVAFTYCLGRAKNVIGTEWWTWICSFAFFYVMSAVLLSKATQTLPIGTAYAVWTGIGAVGAVLVGIIFFKEPTSFWRLFFLSTLILSIVGLKSVSWSDFEQLKKNIKLHLRDWLFCIKWAAPCQSQANLVLRSVCTIFLSFAEPPYQSTFAVKMWQFE